MNGASPAAMLSSWSLSLWVCGPLLLSAALYLRGWRVLRRRGAQEMTGRRLGCFLAGLAVIGAALQSPLDALGPFSLQVHMVQHLLLLLVAPPLLLAGAPLLPVLVGLPAVVREEWLAPFARWPAWQAVWRVLTHPALALLLFTAALWLWHAPAMYELALASPAWHRAEHATFLAAALLFWWPLAPPFPSRSRLADWMAVPYLLLAGVQGTALAALIAFSPRVLYAHYTQAPNLWGLSPLTDQAIAGAIMWVPTSLALLVPLLLVVGRQMSGAAPPRRARPTSLPEDGAGVPELLAAARQRDGGVPLPVLNASGARPAYTRESLLGSLLRPRRTRRGLQLLMLAAALLVMLDGFTGPQVSSVNLAGVLPWIHWRGLLVLGLVAGGNFFCMACPFTALRGVVRRFISPTRNWPNAWRAKWPAVGLLVLFFWAYEAFSLWDRPAWTAAIALGFLSAVVLCDALFVDAPFCKFVCPIGQFNFVQSLVSPTEVAVRDSQVCTRCQTKDCLRGNATLAGCQLELLQPQKQGNLDCTFCLDCADACPQGNVALMVVRPGVDLIRDGRRSGVGRYSRRIDLAALCVLLLFAALVNAAWMTAPVVACEEAITQACGAPRLVVVTLGMLLGLGGIPLVMVSLLGRLSDRFSRSGRGWLANVATFAPALVPLGLGMWLAHYTFHLVTSSDGAWVAARRWAADWLGTSYAVSPAACCCAAASGIAWLLPVELLMLDVGLCLSLWAVYRMAERERERRGDAWRMMLPWCGLLIAFFAASVWVLLQPMQMRGAYLLGGM